MKKIQHLWMNGFVLEKYRSRQSMSKEKKFYNALKDIFVGAKVEGECGYINLMRIKSKYYKEGVFPKLKQAKEEFEPLYTNY
jgi:hypothetical protein